MGADLRGHVVTKWLALRLWLAGRKGAARVAWRWMANRPSPADLVTARATLARPATACEVDRLLSRGGDHG
jgi:hypothetical protein